MREQDHSTPQLKPATSAEAAAQLILTYILVALETARKGLGVVLAILPEPTDAELELIGDGTIPDTLTNTIRGSAECAASDHLDPAIRTLREAAEATPESLYAEWQERQESRP